MEHYQKLHYLFHNLLRGVFKLCGHDIFRDGNFRPYSVTYCMYAVILTFFFGIFKTCMYYDISVVLEMLVLFGLVLEVRFSYFIIGHFLLFVLSETSFMQFFPLF